MKYSILILLCISHFNLKAQLSDTNSYYDHSVHKQVKESLKYTKIQNDLKVTGLTFMLGGSMSFLTIREMNKINTYQAYDKMFRDLLIVSSSMTIIGSLLYTESIILKNKYHIIVKGSILVLVINL